MDSEIVQQIIDLIKEDYLYGIILLLILVALIALGIIYRHSENTQKFINIFENWFFPWIKKERIILEVFTKKIANSKGVEDKYSIGGFKKININRKDDFDNSNWINENNLQEFINKQEKLMTKVKKGSKRKDSLAYLGFPHIPIGFMDGYNFSDTDNVILYEYDGAIGNNPDKDFFELKKTYNSELQLQTNYENYELKGNEIILKVEQSFDISDDEIKSVVGDLDVINLSNKDRKRWGIKSYSDVDKFAREFQRILSWAKDNDVKKIHLVMTTPVSLTFTLGQVISHYSPKIVIYNYNNNKYDWCIDVKQRRVKMIS
ncbi:SAVED domain-containing protein [Clostridium tertium]|uniref:SAVED domain-containing protein n=1 Tax=Clostridium tertium TaxID=1559 RepID=UPI00189C60B9|nr:SAVED domain-containing protein [Clostridium tertium]MDB1946387.1 SAVED domain-containing protein [Clostridium tertium]